MATRGGQRELPGRLPAAILVALTAALVLPPAARAQYSPSGYEPLGGEPFFLLSDKAYGSREVALVRLEVASAQFGLGPVEEYGGVDVALYRVPQPLAFLEKQKNLHRIKTDALPADEGVANTLSHLWDRWVDASRQAWRRVFSSDARAAVTTQAPELKTRTIGPTPFLHPPQFKPLPGFELITHFRYPVHKADPIQPPKEVQLAGSSSHFIDPTPGNVMIPLGQLTPGLYLAEAYVGSHRANTLVFVSDTVAVTKTSGQEVVVWAAERTHGTAVSGVDVAWTDGAGVMKSGRTDARGLATLAHESPERSYVLGVDPQGGAFISENFYYDSEIYDTKIYATTDRPLYRPGDTVFVKVFGRQFQSATASMPAAPGEVHITVFDPNGAPVAHQKLVLQAETGGDTSFRLPENAGAGGYELRMTYLNAPYSAAFRVAEYHKPHFQIALVPDKADFKVNDPVAGSIQLRYTDGKPVANAEVQLTVRSQQLTMVDGELGYYGQFPVKLTAGTVKTDEKGEVRFDLPPVDQPSRYVVTLLATDGSAARVRTTREILVERGRSSFTMQADARFTTPGDTVAFAIRPAGDASEPARAWEWVRLEDRKRDRGPLTAADRLLLTFAEPGSYSLQLRDAHGNVVAATSHWVSGGSLRAPQGSIEMVAGQELYRAGDTAEVLVTFPTEVEEALVTLERDSVMNASLLTRASGWVQARKVTDTQWRVRLPLTASMAPNVTLSVAYVKDGEYVFQNQGLRVAQRRIEVAFTPKKQVYAPGETVEVDVTTRVGDKGVPAVVTVGVVDEMIYVLQPELAPTIDDFFYHLRRNNVRTASSQSFISYDLAVSRSKGAPAPQRVTERRVKVLERPRRDEVDTAFWQPTLRTDAHGRARFSFLMPDALTRWRITGRAMAGDGTVGQRTAWVRSEKDVYLKWTAPEWMRTGDAPIATLAAFNQTSRPLTADLVVAGPGISRKETVTLQPGINVIPQPLGSLNGDGPIQASLVRGGKVADALSTRFTRQAAGWRSPRTRFVSLDVAGATVDLPADARDLEVVFASTAATHFQRIVSDLVDYPYGCIEQTASRMIPLSLAVESLGRDQHRVGDRLRQQLNGSRLRLAYMAGPKATFAWWGVGTTGDPFLTAYAYYADFLSARTLGITLPAEHWNRLLDVYRDGGQDLPLSQRALALSFMQDIGLPVTSLTDGLLEDMAKVVPSAAGRLSSTSSPFLGDPDGRTADELTVLLAERLLKAQSRTLPAELAAHADAAATELRAGGRPFALALLMAGGRLPATEAASVLGAVHAEMPTLERSLTLAWVRQALGPLAPQDDAITLPSPWTRLHTATGLEVWRWPAGTALPRALPLPAGAAARTAVVRFTSVEPEEHRLPVNIDRKLFRVTLAEKSDTKEEDASGTTRWTVTPVGEDEPLLTTELYLDELTLTPNGSPFRYGVLEVPLPPGAAVEGSTWGVELPGDQGKPEPLERARHQETSFGYAVPVDPVAEKARVRHLVRFGQKGVYSVPRARAYRMYLPDGKAFEIGAPSRRFDVR